MKESHHSFFEREGLRERLAFPSSGREGVRGGLQRKEGFLSYTRFKGPTTPSFKERVERAVGLPLSLAEKG